MLCPAWATRPRRSLDSRSGSARNASCIPSAHRCTVVLEVVRAVESDEVILVKLGDAIVLYLALHPDAADTACGIANWWLPTLQRDADQRLIQRVLDRLVCDGRVMRYLLVDGTVLYARDITKDGPAAPS